MRDRPVSQDSFFLKSPKLYQESGQDQVHQSRREEEDAEEMRLPQGCLENDDVGRDAASNVDEEQESVTKIKAIQLMCRRW